MAKAFKCPNCGEVIIVQYVKVGEQALCRNCRKKSVVPESVQTIDDDQGEKYLKEGNYSKPIDAPDDDSINNGKRNNKYDPTLFPKREAAIKKWMPRFWIFFIIGMIFLYLRVRLGFISTDFQTEEGMRSFILIIPQTICFTICLGIVYITNYSNRIKGFGLVSGFINMLRRNQLKYFYTLLVILAIEEIIFWIFDLV